MWATPRQNMNDQTCSRHGLLPIDQRLVHCVTDAFVNCWSFVTFRRSVTNPTEGLWMSNALHELLTWGNELWIAHISSFMATLGVVYGKLGNFLTWKNYSPTLNSLKLLPKFEVYSWNAVTTVISCCACSLTLPPPILLKSIVLACLGQRDAFPLCSWEYSLKFQNVLWGGWDLFLTNHCQMESKSKEQCHTTFSRQFLWSCKITL